MGRRLSALVAALVLWTALSGAASAFTTVESEPYIIIANAINDAIISGTTEIGANQSVVPQAGLTLVAPFPPPNASAPAMGVTSDGNMAIVDDDGQFNFSNLNIFADASIGVQCAGSTTDCNNGASNTTFNGMAFPGTGLTGDVDFTDLVAELNTAQIDIPALTQTATLNVPGGTISGGTTTITLAAGLNVIDVVTGGADFKLENMNFVVQGPAGSSAIFRVPDNANMIVTQSAILIGNDDGTTPDAVMFYSDRPDNGTHFNLSNVVLNGIAFWDLSVALDPSLIVLNNVQGCTQFVGDRINTGQNVRLTRCAFDGSTTTTTTTTSSSTSTSSSTTSSSTSTTSTSTSSTSTSSSSTSTSSTTTSSSSSTSTSESSTSTSSTSTSETSTSSSSTSTSSSSSTSTSESSTSTSSTSTSETSTSSSSTSTSETSTSSSSTSTSNTSTTSTTSPGGTIPCLERDHFKCYHTSQIGFPRFQRLEVTTSDQFGSGPTRVIRPMRLCNPADKNDEGVDDPASHLMCYQADDLDSFRRRHVVVQNQFGEQALSVIRAESLCLPAEKDGLPRPPESTLDHFKCYRVHRRHGTPGFQPRTVTLADQFETKSVTVVKPLLLCNPVDKNGGGITDASCHLTCYKISQESFSPRLTTVVDQFTEATVSALTGACRKVGVLCVPSLKEEVD